MMNPVIDTGNLKLYDQLLKAVAAGTLSKDDSKLVMKAISGETLASVDLGDKADKKAGVFYIEGTGDTAGVWLGSHDDIKNYYPGLMVAYKPSVAGATGLTLNINNLGAVAVVRNATSAITTHYAANSVVFLVYTTDGDAAYWKIADYDSDTKTRSSNKTGSKMYIIGATTQSTSGQTTYSNSNCYIGTDNSLYSKGKKVLDVEGTAASATKLATARTIALSGDATGSAKFDGSGDVTLDVTVSGGVGLSGNKITAALPISAGDIVVYGIHILNIETEESVEGYMPLKDCHMMVSIFPILGATANIAQGADSEDVCNVGKFSVASIQEMALTVGDPVYIRCQYGTQTTTVNGIQLIVEAFKAMYPELGELTYDGSDKLTQTWLETYPEVEEGLLGKANDYILLGYAVSETEVLITADHPVFRDTTNGGFVKFVDAANCDGEGNVISSTYAKKSDVTTLPTASSTTLGGVKIGSNITVSSGTISLTKSNVTSALGYTPLQSYTLPTASSSTLGGVKTTSTVTSTSGLTACPIIGGVPYYKDSNATYTLSSFGVTATADELNKLDGVTATATELNYCDGVTSNIQTQLNGKLSTSGTAAKATADASGNNIANTYMTKSSITSGTSDLTAGTSSLTTGSIYLVYE